MQIPSAWLPLLDADQYITEHRKDIRSEVFTVGKMGKVTPQQYDALAEHCNGLNSYERHWLHLNAEPGLLLRSLGGLFLHTQPVASRKLPTTYDEAVIQVFAPLLGSRLEIEAMNRRMETEHRAETQLRLREITGSLRYNVLKFFHLVP